MCNDDSGAPLRAIAHGRSRPAARRQARGGFAACAADRDPRVDRLQVGGPVGVARRHRRAVQAGRTVERGWGTRQRLERLYVDERARYRLAAQGAGGQVPARRDGERLPVPERVEVLRDEVAQWLCTTRRPGAAPRGIGSGARGSTRTCPQRWRRPRPRATGPARGEPAVERRSGMGRSGDIDLGGTRFGQGACTGRPRSHAVLVGGDAQKVGGVLAVTGGRAFPSKAAARHLPDGAPSRGCKRLSSSLLAMPFRPAARCNLQIA